MIALKGEYDNGIIKLANQAPLKKSSVIVIFPDAEIDKQNKLSEDEAREIFKKYTGSIHRMIDEKNEKLEALDNKYESTD